MQKSMIETHKWLNCTEENYWIEDSAEFNEDYLTIVSMPCDTWDDKNDIAIHEEFTFLKDNCPYSWSSLSKSGGKFMIVEKPKSDCMG